jgi:beta-mannosidase
MTLNRTALAGPWTLDIAEASAEADAEVLAALPVAATVPGSVHTDLLEAGLIADPYLDRNELDVPWIGRSSWSYRTSLPQRSELPAGNRVDLVFDGLDTLATIEVAGVEVARTKNMFRRFRIPVDTGLGEHTTPLSVTFESPWEPFESASEDDRRIFDAPSSHLRKMACNFGWDWGPALVTSGIWRPVAIETWSVARIDSARVDVSVDHAGNSHDSTVAGIGLVQATISVERDGEPRELRVDLGIAGTVTTAIIAAAAAVTTISVAIPLQAAAIWWPTGYGEQPLHDLTITLSDNSTAEPLDSDFRRVGFRSSTVNTVPDADGTPFVFVVNDVDVPVRGFNWIPDDCFPHRVSRANILSRLQAAVDANANLIRVWGGGLYESNDFYDVCDELGLLVWQDFAFACAPYPETPELVAEVEAEARDNVERLMSHAALVLWNGNNENWLGHDDWGWVERLDGRAWGAGYYLDVLPRVVAEVDPGTRYWPGSPYSGTPDRYSNDRAHGVVHLWDAWNSLADAEEPTGYSVFRDDKARFVSEFGWQAPPAWRTLTDTVHDEPLTPTSPGVLHHQKAVDGNGKLSRGLAPYFDEPSDIADWHWAMQLNQARAIRFSVEHFRSLQPLNMGVILWQLNDCWPVASWAVIDGAARRRPGWYATKAVYAPRFATIQPSDTGLSLIVVNDQPREFTGSATVRRVSTAGTELASSSYEFTVLPGSATAIPLPSDIAEPGDQSAELIVADLTGADRAWWYFVSDRDFCYQRPELSISVSPGQPSPDGRRTDVAISSNVFVRDLTVHPDRLGAEVSVDTMLVTLLPGETALFRLTGELAADVETELTGKAVRHAGDLVTFPAHPPVSP